MFLRTKKELWQIRIWLNYFNIFEMENKKQSSIEWLFFELLYTPKDKFEWHSILRKAKAMHKEEIKMIIEHYHNKMFYLELTEIELENITEMIYKETFGGQDNE